MEQAQIQSHIEYHERELARYRMAQAQHISSQSMMGQASAAVLSNAAAAQEARVAGGNQGASGGAQPDHRKADDTELRKIALEYAVKRKDGSQAVEYAKRYFAFLKGVEFEDSSTKIATTSFIIGALGATTQQNPAYSSMAGSGLPG